MLHIAIGIRQTASSKRTHRQATTSSLSAHVSPDMSRLTCSARYVLCMLCCFGAGPGRLSCAVCIMRAKSCASRGPKLDWSVYVSRSPTRLLGGWYTTVDTGSHSAANCNLRHVTTRDRQLRPGNALCSQR